jgi:mannose-6-phosphate isomerase-like protein (cupin superfamily)
VAGTAEETACPGRRCLTRAGRAGRRADGGVDPAGDLLEGGELLTYKVPSQHTGGAYALFEVATQPGVGPPSHIHHREDEAFYVLEGDYEFLIGKKTLRVGAGSLLYVPKGTLHAHRGVGEGVGRMLLTQTPGGLYEHFFEEVGKPMEGEIGWPVLKDEPEVANIATIAAKYGIEIPPLTEETGLRMRSCGKPERVREVR